MAGQTIPEKKDPDLTGFSFPLYENLVKAVLARDDIYPKAKEDLLKAVTLLKFIEVNSDWLIYAVDHKQDPRIYSFNQDKGKGVLRDFNGTSFHINSYHHSKQALETFKNYLIQFKEIVAGVLKAADGNQDTFSDPLLEFAHAFIYEDTVGCMEARLSQPMEVGRKILTQEKLKLDDLMRRFYEQTPNESQRTITNALAFATDYFGTIILTPEGKEAILTAEIVTAYCKDVLYLEDNNDIEQKDNGNKDFFKYLSASVALKEKGKDAIEVCFSKSGDASHFSQLFQPGLHIRVTNVLGLNAVCLSAKQLEKIYPEKDKPVSLLVEDWKFLTNSSSYQSANDFKTRMTQASADAINQALINQNKNGWTGLMMAARYQPEAAFKALIEKASPQAINQALINQNKNGWTGLMMVARYQPEAGFKALVAKASGDAINQALENQDHEGWTELVMAACYQPEAVFQALIAKASGDAINQALVRQDHEGWTGLMTAARYQPAAAFKALIAKASGDTIDQALGSQSHDHGDDGSAPMHLAIRYGDYEGWTGLMMVARYQPGVVKALIKKASNNAISQALVRQDYTGRTGLIIATRYLPGVVFQALIAKASDNAINQALAKQNKNGWTSLHLAIRYQETQSFYQLVDCLSPDSLASQLKLIKLKLSSHHQNEIFKSLARHLYIRSHGNLLAALKPYYSELYPFLRELFFINKNFLPTACLWQIMVEQICQIDSPGLQDILFLKKFYDSHSSVIQAYRCYLRQQFSTEEQPEITLKELFDKVNGKEIDIIERIKKDISFFIKAEQFLIKHRQKFKINDEVTIKNHTYVKKEKTQANMKFFNGSCAQNQVSNKENFRDECLELFKSGDALIKIIKLKHWKGFLEQLKDYSNRPKLRDEKEIGQYQYKFSHLTGKIFSYQNKKKEKSDLKHTKKSAATLISSQLNTPLFGEHDPERQLVGLLFDSKCCEIKAMLTEDRGTYNKKWVGSYEEVTSYRTDIAAINCCDYSYFKKAIKFHSGKVNEVLTEFSREALKAVVIARDTPDARRLAQQYVKELQETLDIVLPIYCYDYLYRSVYQMEPAPEPNSTMNPCSENNRRDDHLPSRRPA